MELRDLVVTPFWILLVYAAAYVIRPYVCDSQNYRYFFPALTLKIVGAVALGFIYQYYYNGGDTYNYHTFGSRVIWDVFVENPIDGLGMIFLPIEWQPPEIQYIGVTKLIFYGDPASYFVVRVLGLVDLFTFSTYSASAVVFAAISFAGAWMMFLAFYRAYPSLLHWLAASIFFIPSVFFWGSGILKDTLVVAALGASVFFIQAIFIERRPTIWSVLALFLCLATIYMTKKYVLICFVPAAVLWIYLKQLLAIRSLALRIVVVPFFIALIAISGYYSVLKIGEGDAKYSLDKLAITARVTAYDIGFYSGKDAGSGYSIGNLDGTFSGMLLLAPQAINVSLFRPYIWEVKNPLMLMSAVESLFMLFFTFLIIVRNPVSSLRAMKDPYVLFCLAFSLAFAFAVGISTFNFGTLARYKIPMMPFYVLALVLIDNYLRIERNRSEFEARE